MRFFIGKINRGLFLCVEFKALPVNGWSEWGQEEWKHYRKRQYQYNRNVDTSATTENDSSIWNFYISQ